MDDLSRFCCLNPACPLHGRRDAGNLSVRDRYGKPPHIRLPHRHVPGSRSIESAEEIIREVHVRTAGASDVLLTSDEYPAYATAIAHVYGVAEGPRPAGTPGRPPLLPAAHVPADLTYATVHKERAR